jgi:hypothetical protein
LKRECQQKTKSGLENVLQKPDETFTGFTELQAKLDAGTLLDFAIHHSQREQEVEKAFV